MITWLANLSNRIAVLCVISFSLVACGGGGGGGGGFIPADGNESLPLTIATDALPDASAGADYTALVEANGGKAPYSWAITDDGGTGLEINNEGFITGTAPEKGQYGLTIEVTDKSNKTDKLSTILTVVSGPDSLAITTTALPSAIDGVQYTALVQAAGGKEPYSWTIVDDGGTGFTINNEGFLTGTAPESGNYGLTIQVEDSVGTTNKSSIIMTVAGGETPQPLAIATNSLPAAEEKTGYTAILEAVGGQGDYLWTMISSGGSGLQLRDDGVLSGTAPAKGDYAITVSVQDDTRTVTNTFILTVAADSDALTISTGSLPAGVVGVRYAAVLNASGGTKPYVWTLASSNTAGLGLTPAGVLTGIPNAPGTFGIVFRVSDGTSTDQLALTVTIAPGGGIGAEDPLSIQTNSLPAADRVLYAAAVKAAGGIPPYTWTGGDTGSPGTGFQVEPVSGSITGNTNDLLPGQYGYSVTVTDTAGDTDTRSYVITVPGGDTPPVKILTENPLPRAYESLFYTTILRAVGGTGLTAWSVIDTVGFPGTAPSFASPEDIASGVLTWNSVDVAQGSYLITIQVDDTDDGSSDVVTFDLQASAAPVRITTDNPLPGAIEGVTYSTVIVALGGGATNTWSVLSVTKDDIAYVGGPAFVGGGISDGTLTWDSGDVESGNYVVTVEVVSVDADDFASSDQKTFNLEVLPATP